MKRINCEGKRTIGKANKGIKQKLKNKTKARSQVGNKAMKTKLTNILRENEIKKRKIVMQN